MGWFLWRRIECVIYVLNIPFISFDFCHSITSFGLLNAMDSKLYKEYRQTSGTWKLYHDWSIIIDKWWTFLCAVFFFCALLTIAKKSKRYKKETFKWDKRPQQCIRAIRKKAVNRIVISWFDIAVINPQMSHNFTPVCEKKNEGANGKHENKLVTVYRQIFFLSFSYSLSPIAISFDLIDMFVGCCCLFLEMKEVKYNNSIGQ